MSKQYKCHIFWDEAPHLPKDIIVELDESYLDEDNDNVDEAVGDALVEQLTDEYGYCIEGLSYEEVL